jgi:hypothetical protein
MVTHVHFVCVQLVTLTILSLIHVLTSITLLEDNLIHISTHPNLSFLHNY